MCEQESSTTQNQQEGKLHLPQAAIPKMAHALAALHQKLGRIPHHRWDLGSINDFYYPEGYPIEHLIVNLTEAGVLFKEPRNESNGNK